jgi:adenosylcobinamide kinase/adenosylcobinamide-phosphate guanylyltransferase
MARLVMAAGASRSGKSAWAEARLADRRRVAYLATLEPHDAELGDRIARHRARRAASWTTVEAPRRPADAARALPPDHDGILLDCLTGFLGNRLLDRADPEGRTPPDALDRILADADDLFAALRAHPAEEAVVVTNEVGAGVVPPHPLGRAFRDLQGWANQRLAAAADEVQLLRFGLPTRLK